MRKASNGMPMSKASRPIALFVLQHNNPIKM
jgi:hypothetical protein